MIEIKRQQSLRWFAGAILLCFASVQVARSQAPTLEVVGIIPPRNIQMILQGQDSSSYNIDISTNLIFWQTLLSLTPTNGSAAFSHDGAASESVLFFRASQGRVATNPGVQLQVSPLSAESVVTSDGGSAELITPDLRHITLTIPAGCVDAPQAFSMTLITNVEGLPLAQGAFGAVLLEPEGLTFSGAASLEIEFPPGLDTRQVVSFGANNDGSALHLMIDRVFTNRVAIPITELAAYGSALSTQSELDGFFNTLGSNEKFGRKEPRSDFHYFNTSKFPQSCVECFNSLVQRALAVRADLNAFLQRTFIEPAGKELADARQQQLLGQPDHSSNIVAHAMEQICPIYEAKIEPLWAESSQNCALGVVLIDFVLGLERQVQILGVTNIVCPFTLETNLAAACVSAHECLREIDQCCLTGHKGPGRILEAWSVIRPFTYEGYTSCFPLEDDDPEVKVLIRDCVTNAWYGTMKLTVKGDYSTSTKSAIGSGYRIETVNNSVDISLDKCTAFYSLEDPLTATAEGFLIVNAAGTGSVKLHNTSLIDNAYYCTGGNLVHAYQSEQYDTVGITNFFEPTNDLATASAAYSFDFVLNTNRTYQILSSGGLNLDFTTDVTQTEINANADCKGGVKTEVLGPLKRSNLFSIPNIFTTNQYVFPMLDANSIAGSIDVVAPNSFDSTSQSTLKEHLEWSFHKNTNAPPSGP